VRERLARTLEIRTSPHIVSGYAVDTIMFNVVVALAPATVFALWAFGWSAAAVLATAIGSCVLFEHLVCRARGRATTVGDWSAAVTGLLYGLTLPASLPLWMVAVGGAVSVLLGKLLFGGLGRNPFNPALVGRAVLQATFPVQMTTWLAPFAADRFARLPSSTLAAPFLQPVYDVATGATPLSAWKFGHQATGARELALGLVGGSTGETSAVLLLAGAAYLVARNMMGWRTPAAILAAVAALSGALHLADPERYASPAFMLFAGGLMLGALFMATDMVTSPITHAGCWAYGALIGVVVVAIRAWGGMPEGVMYAILLGNAVAPHLDRLFQPRVYGAARRRPAEAER
jgi:electron transport complex protein RnfD